MIVTFSGGSDDIVSTAIGKSIAKLKRDEAYVADAGKISFARFEVRTIGGTNGVEVTAIYTGCWSFAYGLLDEGRQLPRWAFAVEREHDYSTRLVIDTVEDLVELVQIEPKPQKGDD